MKLAYIIALITTLPVVNQEKPLILKKQECFSVVTVSPKLGYGYKKIVCFEPTIKYYVLDGVDNFGNCYTGSNLFICSVTKL